MFVTVTLQGMDTYPTKREKENHLQICHFWGDMLVPWRVLLNRNKKKMAIPFPTAAAICTSRGLGGAEGHSLSVHWLPRGDLVRSKRGFEIVGAVKNESPG